MKVLEINKKLTEKVENVYKIKGDDAFLVKNAINNIKTFCIKQAEEFNFVKLEGEKLTVNEFVANITTLPFANDYRVVVIDNPNAEIVKTINKFEFDSTIVLIVLNCANLKVGETIDCSKLDRTDINRYVLNYLKKANMSIMESALDYLVDATNSDMSKIVNELNKIVSYNLGKATIDLPTVLNLVASSNEYVSYMLTSAIDEKNYSKFQKILSTMTKSITASEAFSYLGKYFRRMQYVAVNKNDEELSQILSIKPYAVKMSRQFVTKNGVKYYIHLYKKYIELDYKIKSGKITAINALYELIF